MKYIDIKSQLIEYFKNGETKSSNYKVGVEFEHFIIDRKTYKTVSYYGKNGVGESIGELCEIFSAEPIKDGDYILGFQAENFSISTEPGSQFEVSIQAQDSIEKLEKIYLDFINTAKDLFSKKGQYMLCLGYHPVTKIDEITLLPKERYRHMFEHFKKRGSMAHNMMKGSASVQVALDYTCEEDFKEKYFVGSALSPILYSIFDNSPIFENKPYEEHNLREKIWENTDSERSGLLKLGFDEDLSYEKYADFILNTTPIFEEKNGKVFDVSDKKLYEIFEEDDGEDLIFHAISIVFPDIRLKTYVEFRMFDSVPYPLNYSIVTLLKGLFYSKENLDQLKEKFKSVDYKTCIQAKVDSEKYGLAAKYLGKTILEHANELVEMAKAGLVDEERKYLDPLEKLLASKKTRKEAMLEILENQGLEGLIKESILEVEDEQ